MRQLKSILKRIPGVVPLYTKFLYPRFVAADKRPYRTSRWIRTGQQFVVANNLADIIFTQKGVWVRDNTGAEWAYMPGLNGGVHGMELNQKPEQAELELLLRLLQPGHVFVDIGANIGFYSIRVGRAIPDVRVFAFEPVRSTFESLEKNIERNLLKDRVRPFRFAVGDRNGRCRVTSELMTGNFLLPDSSGVRVPGMSEEVTQITLDSFVESERLSRLDFIKCDAEGAEKLILDGARITIQRFRPSLLLEIYEPWTRRFGYSPVSIFEILADFGYTYQCVSARGLCQASGDPLQDLKVAHNFYFSPQLPKL